MLLLSFAVNISRSCASFASTDSVSCLNSAGGAGRADLNQSGQAPSSMQPASTADVTAGPKLVTP
jgi:hypothetical protein